MHLNPAALKIAYLPLLTLGFFIVSFQLFAQNSPCVITTFQKIYGRQNTSDIVWDIIETQDHGFITGGWRGNTYDECTLIKIDSKGNVVWSRQLTGNNTPKGFMKRFIRLKDGNYIGVGRAYSPDYLDTWLIKFDESGNIIWNKELIYPTGIGTEVQSICETADGGLAMACWYQPFPNYSGSLIVKCDANGDLIWSKICFNAVGTADIIERNGVLFIAGQDIANSSGAILKMRSSDGFFLEGQRIKVDNKYTSFQQIEEKNNKYYIIGNNRDLPNDSLKQIVVILDGNLNVLKAHKFNWGFRHGFDYPSMFPTADGEFIVAESDERNPDLLLMKVSYDGIIKWKRQYARPGAQVTFNIKPTSDNGIIGVGTSNIFGGYYTSPNTIFIYKTDHEGLTDCAVTEPDVAIYSPPYTQNWVSYSYTSQAFPIIAINSMNNAFSVPVATFCERIIVPSCTSLKITGKDTICNLSETIIYNVVRNSGCNAAVTWNADPAFVKVLYATESTMAVQFIKPGSTKLIASVSEMCNTVADSLLIHVFNSPDAIQLGPDFPLCQNTSTTLHAGPGFKNYVWQDGSNDSVVVVQSPGDYYVTVTNYCNEIFSDTVKASLVPMPANFLIKDTALCEGVLTTIQSLSNFRSYLWSTGETTKQIGIKSTGVYWLQVENDEGCSAKEFINVKSKDGCTIGLFFPNAFTPNNDRVNDQFKGTAFGILKKFHLRIYNRYGNMVFETYDIGKGWDGKLKGVEQNSGSFVWYSEYQFENRPPQRMKGILILAR